MRFSNGRAALLLMGALLVATACSGNNTVPSSMPVPNGAAAPVSGAAANDASPDNASADDATADTSSPDIASPDDNTSILKKLKKDVVIGSTVDPKNGDTGPHGVSVVRSTYGLKKGQLLVCNFRDKTGASARGTTIETLDPTPGSKPARFAQSSKIEGCSGTAVATNNHVYATGLISGLLVELTQKGKVAKTYGSPYQGPFSDVDASNPGLYSAEYIFGSDAATGSIISFSINYYGNPKPTQVATGFAVNK
ncbi:MAG: hypothetical protein JO104_03930, partial [Candidatus Eremiobacteraeota bacterium]|nr:hypothetical protein [Candidatus Eremiobacteraeota bacterium]